MKQRDGSLFDITLWYYKLSVQWGNLYAKVARIKSKGKIYHIMIKGINQQNILMVKPAKCSSNYARQGFKISKRTGWLLIKAGI